MENKELYIFSEPDTVKMVTGVVRDDECTHQEVMVGVAVELKRMEWY
ncbi:MAG: hypothetical protein ETSY1_45955 [Candidatus Entotheonella factor]|uniref:Uncharacterized protein n=1 Tax=Entotheonella factor TaxID=1429438 RepID=W4L1P9_ENTF1|nr:MAG: hypothetical protein ETSY1_45955 [Candidatus Entotheonella factor]